MKVQASKKRPRKTPVETAPRTELLSAVAPENRRRCLEWFTLSVLLIFGIYLVTVYFGQKEVPNSDFGAFVQVGRQIADFQTPTSFKRVPLLGLMQVFAAQFVRDSQSPAFIGGLIVNSVLYTLSILLFYKIGRLFCKPAGAFCLTLIAAVNPYSLLSLVDPIVETAMVFFLLLTVYLVCIRSWWCYPAAMLASMTRYECFALIAFAFVTDMLLRPSGRQKITALALSFLAAIPMLLWLIGTKLNPGPAGGHYFRVLLDVEHRNGVDLFKMLWLTAFSSLLQWPQWIDAHFSRAVPPGAMQSINAYNAALHWALNAVAALAFMVASVLVIAKKQWKFLPLLLFWFVYVSVHSMQSVLLHRYTVPVLWLTLLLTAWGVKILLEQLSRRLPAAAVDLLMLPVLAVSLFWMLSLWPSVGRTAIVSPASKTVYMAGLMALAVFAVSSELLCRRPHWIRRVGLFSCTALLLVSNQFTLAVCMGKGDTDIEFKKLAAWFDANAAPGEKLVATLPNIVRMFLPPEKQALVIHTGDIPADNLAEFAHACRKANIKYVAWDSRLGFAVNDYYYKHWTLGKIHPLASGRNIGPFQQVRRIDNSKTRFIYLYELDFSRLAEPTVPGPAAAKP